MFVHLTLLPHLGAADELKTKPTQHSVRELRAIGITPDAIVLRTDSSRPIPIELKEKIALFCDVPAENVVQNGDASTIYQRAAQPRSRRFGRDRDPQAAAGDAAPPQLEEWSAIVERIENPRGRIKVALVGKYVELKDAYISISEAIDHAGIYHDVAVDVLRVDSERIEDEGSARSTMSTACWSRRASARAASRASCCAIQRVREAQDPVPRDLLTACSWRASSSRATSAACADAMTTEVDETTPDPVIDFLPEQRNLDLKGGTMRLGAYDCELEPDSLAARAYGADADQRTPSPPLRIQQQVQGALRRAPHGLQRASPARPHVARRTDRTAAERASRGSSGRKRIPNTRAARTVRPRSTGTGSVLRWSGRAPASALATARSCAAEPRATSPSSSSRAMKRRACRRCSPGCRRACRCSSSMRARATRR